MAGIFSSVFFDSLKQEGTGGIAAEIPSGKKGYRRWIELTVRPLDNESQIQSLSDTPEEKKTFQWKFIVFDFDHEKHPLPDSDSFDQDAIYKILEYNNTVREIVYEFQTTDTSVLKQELQKFVEDQDLFRPYQADYPCLF